MQFGDTPCKMQLLHKLVDEFSSQRARSLEYDATYKTCLRSCDLCLQVTQGISLAAGSEDMLMRQNNVGGPEEEGGGKRFYLQYTFPPSSVGETGRTGFVGRREAGHGSLAERALSPIIPSEVRCIAAPHSWHAKDRRGDLSSHVAMGQHPKPRLLSSINPTGWMCLHVRSWLHLADASLRYYKMPWP